MKKEEAWERAERLRAFREDLADFEQDGLFDRDQLNRDRLDSYQRQLLAELARLNNAEAAAAKKRFRRRLRLAILWAVLAAVATLSWLIRSGILPPEQIPGWLAALGR